jgi:hypothetical protein
MGPIVLIAFLGTFLIALIGVVIVKLYYSGKAEEEKIVAHIKEHHHKE